MSRSSRETLGSLALAYHITGAIHPIADYVVSSVYRVTSPDNYLDGYEQCRGMGLQDNLSQAHTDGVSIVAAS